MVVVDDGSPEPLAPVAQTFSDALKLRVIRQDNQGPAAARNRGAAEAEGDWLAFTDDDCRPDPLWLHHLAEAAQCHPGAALGGQVRNALHDNLCAEASQWLVDYLYHYFRHRPVAPAFFTSNNLAFPAEAFREIGGFDTSFPLAAGEDREICDRWRRGGRPLRFVPDALVLHEHSLKPATFWRQHFHYGRGAYQFHQSRRRHQQDRVQVEPLQFYRDLLLYPLSRQPGWKGAAGCMLMLVSQVANASGYAVERWRAARLSGSATGAIGPG